MARHRQRGPRARTWFEATVLRRIEGGVRSQSSLGRELDGLWDAQVRGVDMRGVGDLDDLLRARVEVDRQHALVQGCRSREEPHLPPPRLSALEPPSHYPDLPHPTVTPLTPP